jgi:hypothetical protein
MTDVQETQSAASEETAAPRRRRARGPGASTTTSRRGSLRGADLIESLRESVEQLIRENRTLKRQLARMTAGGGSPAASGAERTLRAIQRKVMRAVSGDGAPRRRSRTASAPRVSTTTSGGRRRRATRSTAGSGE